jgi:transposase InsO family protein
VLDWFTRRVLAWRVSITLEAGSDIEAVEKALARHGKPETFNTDQGSQFTSTEFIKVLASREIKISMDGKGAWRDNVFVERLWRTIKYEEVYLRATPVYPRLGHRLGDISASTTVGGPTDPLTGKHPIRPTSTSRRPKRRERKPSGNPLENARKLLKQTEPPLASGWRPRPGGAGNDAAPADPQHAGLAADAELRCAIDHFLALGNRPALPNAPDNKSFSSASSPIFACRVFTSMTGSTSDCGAAPKKLVAPSKS